MSLPICLTDDNFKREVLDADLPVLVDFWASWCPPCKMVEPIIVELAEEFARLLKVGKLNVDQNPRMASRYHIMGVPSFFVFNSGEVILQRTGAQSTEQLRQMLKEVI